MKYLEKIRKYFFELVTMFVGVTLAFYVENYRQNSDDKENERKYLHGLLDDLKTDSISFINASSNLTNLLSRIDTLQSLIGSKDNNTYDKVRLLAQSTMIYFDLGIENNSSYKTIISSGQIKLLESVEYTKSLNNYYRIVDFMLRNYQDEFTTFRTNEYYPYLNANLYSGDFFWDNGFHMVAKNKLKTKPELFLDQSLENYVIRTRQYFHDFKGYLNQDMIPANTKLNAETRNLLKKI